MAARRSSGGPQRLFPLLSLRESLHPATMASKLIPILVFLFDLAAFSLVVAAELRRITITPNPLHLLYPSPFSPPWLNRKVVVDKDKNYIYCVYDSKIATWFGAGALLFLLASQILAVAANKCFCCGPSTVALAGELLALSSSSSSADILPFIFEFPSTRRCEDMEKATVMAQDLKLGKLTGSDIYNCLMDVFMVRGNIAAHKLNEEYDLYLLDCRFDQSLHPLDFTPKDYHSIFYSTWTFRPQSQQRDFDRLMEKIGGSKMKKDVFMVRDNIAAHKLNEEYDLYLLDCIFDQSLHPKDFALKDYHPIFYSTGTFRPQSQQRDFDKLMEKIGGSKMKKGE